MVSGCLNFWVISGIAGVESVAADVATNTVVVAGTAEAAALKARIEAKTKKPVEVVSAGGGGAAAKKPAAEPKAVKDDGGEKKDAQAKEEKGKKQPPEEKKPKEVGTQEATLPTPYAYASLLLPTTRLT